MQNRILLLTAFTCCLYIVRTHTSWGMARGDDAFAPVRQELVEMATELSGRAEDRSVAHAAARFAALPEAASYARLGRAVAMSSRSEPAVRTLWRGMTRVGGPWFGDHNGSRLSLNRDAMD